APITTNGFKADAFRPVKLEPGVMQYAIDKQRALIHQAAYVFAFTKAHVKLFVCTAECIFKDADDGLFGQCPAKAALIKEKQRSFKIRQHRRHRHDVKKFLLRERSTL